MISKPEGDYTFNKDDRERIKTRSMLPTDTLRYIEALEAVAKAAYKYWSKVGQPQQSQLDADLYDALAVVDWMNDDQP